MDHFGHVYYHATGRVPILSDTMSRRPKKIVTSSAGLSEAAKLLERATKQPGVADLLLLYQQHAETVRQAEAYLQPRDRRLIFSTSDATA